MSNRNSLSPFPAEARLAPHHGGLARQIIAAAAQESLCEESPAYRLEWRNRISAEDLHAFSRVFERQQLHAVFQPILDLSQRRFLGYEGLIRGPADTPLHSPQLLLELAAASQLTVEFERLCRETILRDFAARKLDGLLFLNVSAGALADPRFLDGATTRLFQELRLRPGQIVIEITENQQVDDLAALQEVLQHYRGQGFQIAIDDLGEGFSNLRMWSEIHPEYVKIDQHFIRNIANDPIKFRLVRAMRDIAEATHARLIAEGIETESELITIRDLGIAHGQGFLISRPAIQPETAPGSEVRRLLDQSRLIVFPNQPGQAGAKVRQLLQAVEPVLPSTCNQRVLERFEASPSLIALPIVTAEGIPVGLINRYTLTDRFARPYRREIYGKQPCTRFMNDAPIKVDHALPIQELGQLLGRAQPQQLIDGFIITEDGRYLGVGSTQALMGLITELQIRAARYANPLTQLPGNVPINEHIDRLLHNEVGFTACYCDIDHFKPFNDSYGYRTGDQIIQQVALLLSRHCDPQLDFVGHIGGDDFILLMQSSDWEARCRAIIADFDQARIAYLMPEHVDQSGYFAENRRGEKVFHALPSLSIGALTVVPHHFESHRELSVALTAAKKEAKKIPGSALFIERRRQP